MESLKPPRGGIVNCSTASIRYVCSCAVPALSELLQCREKRQQLKRRMRRLQLFYKQHWARVHCIRSNSVDCAYFHSQYVNLYSSQSLRQSVQLIEAALEISTALLLTLFFDVTAYVEQ
jgi:hypothetical protein